MMAQNQILISVTELLSKNHFVQIENLGSFFLKEMDANFNPFTNEVKPRHTQIVFNADLSQNDGVLAQYLMSQYSLSFKEANSLISNWVLSTKAKLIEKKYLSFHPLGNFFYNETTGLFFVGRSQANLHSHNFGLKPLIWDPKIHHKLDSKSNQKVVESKLESANAIDDNSIEDAELVDVSTEFSENQIHIQKTKHNILWNIAATFAIIAVGATVLYFGAQTISDLNHISTQTASSSPELTIQKQMDVVNSSEATSVLEQNSDQNANLTSPETTSINQIEASESNSTASKKVESQKNSTPKVNTTEQKSRFVVVAGRVIEIKPKASKSANVNADMLLNSDQFRAQIVEEKGAYYVVGGSYLTENAARIEIRQWNKLNREATYFHVAESSLIKIVLKRCKSQKDASEFAVSIKEIPTQSISIQELKLIK